MSIPERAKRVSLKSKVEFFVDADIVNAESVNISESGICFETEKPLKILMRLNKGDSYEEHEAELVWAKSNDNSGMTYGLKFLSEDEEYLKKHFNKS